MPKKNVAERTNARDVIELTLGQAEQLLRTMDPATVPVLWGPPGVGKSEMLKSLVRSDRDAEGTEAELRTLQLSSLMVEDTSGLPTISADGYSRYAPNHELFSLSNAYVELERQKDPSFATPRKTWVFLDELANTDPRSMAAFQCMLLGQLPGLGGLPMRDPSSVRLIAASNSVEDGAFCFDLSEAAASRVMHLHVRPDRQEWLRWARANDLWPMLDAFLSDGRNQKWFHNFDPSSAEDTFGCPRTWWKLSVNLHSLARNGVTDPKLRMAAIFGLVGASAGRAYWQFEQAAVHAPSPSEILADPDGAPLPPPDRPDIAIATVETLIHAMHTDTERFVAAAPRYVARMSREFQGMFTRSVLNLYGTMPADALRRVLGSPQLRHLQDGMRHLAEIEAELTA